MSKAKENVRNAGNEVKNLKEQLKRRDKKIDVLQKKVTDANLNLNRISDTIQKVKDGSRDQRVLMVAQFKSKSFEARSAIRSGNLGPSGVHAAEQIADWCDLKAEEWRRR